MGELCFFRIYTNRRTMLGIILNFANKGKKIMVRELSLVLFEDVNDSIIGIERMIDIQRDIHILALGPNLCIERSLGETYGRLSISSIVVNRRIVDPEMFVGVVSFGALK